MHGRKIVCLILLNYRERYQVFFIKQAKRKNLHQHVEKASEMENWLLTRKIFLSLSRVNSRAMCVLFVVYVVVLEVYKRKSTFMNEIFLFLPSKTHTLMCVKVLRRIKVACSNWYAITAAAMMIDSYEYFIKWNCMLRLIG